MEFNQHFLERASAELLEAWHVVIKLNTEPLAVDRIKTCQDWLQAFSRRRIEDATYAADVTRALSVVGVKVSVGFNTKNDPQTSRTA
jgi:hypothetical protein